MAANQPSRRRAELALDRPVATINDLPFEMLVQIFHKLDNVTRRKMEGVCRRWKSILRETLSLSKSIKVDMLLVPHHPQPSEKTTDLIEMMEHIACRPLYSPETYTLYLVQEDAFDDQLKRRAKSAAVRGKPVEQDTFSCEWLWSTVVAVRGLTDWPYRLVVEKLHVDYIDIFWSCFMPPSPRRRDFEVKFHEVWIEGISLTNVCHLNDMCPKPNWPGLRRFVSFGIQIHEKDKYPVQKLILALERDEEPLSEGEEKLYLDLMTAVAVSNADWDAVNNLAAMIEE